MDSKRSARRRMNWNAPDASLRSTNFSSFTRSREYVRQKGESSPVLLIESNLPSMLEIWERVNLPGFSGRYIRRNFSTWMYRHGSRNVQRRVWPRGGF